MFVMLSVHSLSSIGEDLQRAAQTQTSTQPIEDIFGKAFVVRTPPYASSGHHHHQQQARAEAAPPPPSQETIQEAQAKNGRFSINCANLCNNSSSLDCDRKNPRKAFLRSSSACNQEQEKQRGSRCWSSLTEEEQLNNQQQLRVRRSSDRERGVRANSEDVPSSVQVPVATILNDLSPVPKKVTNERRGIETTSMSPQPMTLKGWHSKSPDAKAMR